MTREKMIIKIELRLISCYPFGGTRQDSGSLNTRYKFIGQEKDPETGLYNYVARLYDPIIARFISADSIVQDQTDPQTLNRYSYTGNDPVLHTDPTGNFYGDNNHFLSYDNSDFWSNDSFSDMFGGGSDWLGGGFDASDTYQDFGDESNWCHVSISLSTNIYDPLYSNSWGVSKSQPNGWNVGTPIHLGGSTNSSSSWSLDNIDWDRTLTGISTALDAGSAVAGLVSIFPPAAPIAAPLAGLLKAASYGLTAGSVFINYYEYASGKMTRNQFAVRAALDVAPAVLGGAGKLGGSVLGETVGASMEGISGVTEHQLGVLGAFGVTDRVVDATVK